ncbi:hypothetical protein A2U01_0027435, partial [Trifolium medium]|nr:hypothetical protein [Trifolium medium]
MSGVQVHEFNDANKLTRPSQVVARNYNTSSAQSFQFSMFVDAGCFSNAQTGWGLVLKGQSGDVTWSACRREGIEVTPILAEALGLRWATQTALIQGIQSISHRYGIIEIVTLRKDSETCIGIMMISFSLMHIHMPLVNLNLVLYKQILQRMQLL